MKIKDLFKEGTYYPNWEYIESIDVFKTMATCPHSKVWHVEGSPWQHTKMVAMAMRHLLTYMEMEETMPLSINYKQLMMAAALCHDVGKTCTTYYDEKDDDYHCKSHGAAAEPIVRELFKDENDEQALESLVWLVRYHMDFHSILMKKNPKNVLNKLSEALKEHDIDGYIDVRDMLKLNTADSLGSINEENVLKRIKAVGDLIDEWETDNSKLFI